MELPLKTPITFFVRIKGETGVRELRAVLDTGSAYTLIPKKDAIQLGYQAWYDPLISDSGQGVKTVMGSIIIAAPFIILQEVSVGELTAKNVEAVAWDMPRPSGADVLLGLSFLKNFTITIDYKKGILRIE